MITDFIEDRRPLVLGGSVFLMRRVPFSAVVRLFHRLSEATMAELRRSADKLEASAVLDRFGPPEIAEMLSWILEPKDRVLIEAALRIDGMGGMTRAVELLESMNDLERIGRSLARAADGADGGGADREGGPGGMELMLDIVARRYCEPPHAVAEWPFEEVLGVIEIAEHEASQAREQFAQPGPSHKRVIKLGSDDITEATMRSLGMDTLRKVN